ncbi:hypothetical protein DXX93_12055 [Thalassotalea euphylliae]|uniref:LRAT domain-containing protein n=1 Tax=Thalassotalea euphylliae TaxID=1655234 RepID=A0A3E0TRW4_9GAMM|nr:hypothetical protein [Thalassotalea euphylliae]REL27224.1 hypothetical protein DXX93_12055 [Thalassotalea euphylliae]
MPIPFFWLGAAAVSAFAVKELVSEDRKKQQQQRLKHPNGKPLNKDFASNSDTSAVAIYPSELFNTEQIARPTIGAIVCCGIGGVLDHTGIWIGDDTIIELGGNGLIKPVSPARFTQERSGKRIFVACDSTATPLASEVAAQRAIAQIYQYRDYHLIENNCHQFIWQCIQPNDEPLTTFRELNKRMAKRYNKQVYWDLCQV